VRAGQDRQADRVGILGDGGLDDLLRGLVQAGVDDLHPGVAQRPGDDLRAPVVPVQARLGDDDAQGAGGRHGSAFQYWSAALRPVSQVIRAAPHG
jgi:hypothetical protein